MFKGIAPLSQFPAYITPAFSGIPNTGGKIKAKKNKKTKKKYFPIVSLILPTVLHTEPTRTFQLQRHCFTH